ncbi:MAG: PAS sensor protein [Alistipes sp.]
MDNFQWAEELNCAVTVCDTDGLIRYQNDKSRTVNGEMLGQSMIPCHNDHSRQIIAHLLATGGTNTYTIEKRGIRKMIYQSVWRKEGVVCGLVEFSMEIPAEMPHYIRG